MSSGVFSQGPSSQTGVPGSIELCDRLRRLNDELKWLGEWIRESKATLGRRTVRDPTRGTLERTIAQNLLGLSERHGLSPLTGLEVAALAIVRGLDTRILRVGGRSLQERKREREKRWLEALKRARRNLPTNRVVKSALLRFRIRMKDKGSRIVPLFDALHPSSSPGSSRPAPTVVV